MSRETFTELPPMLAADIPREKSWDIRHFAQDTLHGYEDMDQSIDPSLHIVSTDHLAVHQARQDIKAGRNIIRVGESGTLLRVLDHIGLALGHNWEFAAEGTLEARRKSMVRARDTAGMSLDEMLKLDKHSSQHATGAVLAGNTEPMPIDAPYHLQMTYEAVAHWHRSRWQGDTWQPRTDRTLYRHGIAYLGYLMTGEMELELVQPEDYPIARVFGLTTPEEALDMGWDSLHNHESNRILAVEDAIRRVEAGEIVPYADHRILQALRMKYGFNIHFAHPEAISKSWPIVQFNRFVVNARRQAQAA